jgi:hypothetical protein
VNSKKTSIALCVGIIMALAMILPAMAAPFSLTVATGQTSYAQGATATIAGTLTDAGAPAAGLLVSVKVTDLTRQRCIQHNRNHRRSRRIQHKLPTPTRNITASRNIHSHSNSKPRWQPNRNSNHKLYCNISCYGSTKNHAVTKHCLITTVIGEGFTAADTITISWGTTAIPTVPQTVSVSSSGTFTAIVSAQTATAGNYTITAADQHGNTATATLTVPDMKGAPGATGAPGPKGDTGATGATGAHRRSRSKR